jgi:hypothetical protein
MGSYRYKIDLVSMFIHDAGIANVQEEPCSPGYTFTLFDNPKFPPGCATYDRVLGKKKKRYIG